MTKRKATNTFTGLGDLYLPPAKSSKHTLDEVVWSLPADHARHTLLPVDQERNIIHSLADFNQRQPLITYSTNDIGVSAGDIGEIEGVREGEEEDEDNEEQAFTTISLLALPNTLTEAATLSSEQEERLIALHVKPYRDPNAVEYATETGAHVEDLITNTGVYKGVWPGGVDRDTHYAGEMMLFPTAEGVHETLNIDDPIVARCDEPRGYVDAETQTDEEVFSSTPGHLANAWSATTLPHPIKLHVETALSRKTVRFAFTSLKTSSEPAFVRAQGREDDGDTSAAATSAQNPPLLLSSSPTEGNLPLDAPPSLRALMQALCVPNSLNELEIIVEALAKGLKTSPSSSYMDMYGGNGFDVQEDMLKCTRPLERRDRQRTDYSGMLLGPLNFDKEGDSAYKKDGGGG